MLPNAPIGEIRCGWRGEQFEMRLEYRVHRTEGAKLLGALRSSPQFERGPNSQIIQRAATSHCTHPPRAPHSKEPIVLRGIGLASLALGSDQLALRHSDQLSALTADFTVSLPSLRQTGNAPLSDLLASVRKSSARSVTFRGWMLARGASMAGAATATRHMNSVLELDLEPVGDGRLDDYRRYLDQLAAGRGPSTTLETRSGEHASVMVAQLAKHTSKELLILTRDLEDSVYGTDEVLLAVQGFLERGGKIVLLHENLLPETNRLRTVLRSWEPVSEGRVQVKHVPPLIQSGYKYNFDLGDGRSFRFKPKKDGDQSLFQFNETAHGKMLREFFLQILSAS